jgi:glycogen operon protein
MSWLDWNLDDAAASLLELTQRLVGIRAASPALRQPLFFDGRIARSGEPDLVWLRPDSAAMAEIDWFDDDRRTLGVWIDGATACPAPFEPTLDSGTPDGTMVDQTPLPSGSQILLSGRTTLLLRVPRSTK